MIDIRANNIFWKEFEDASKAAAALKCGYFKNGLFDLEDNEAANKMLHAYSASAEIKEEAQRFLNGDIETFTLTHGAAD